MHSLPAEVWTYLRKHPGAGATAIGRALNAHPSRVKHALATLVERQYVIRVKPGCYRIADGSEQPRWSQGTQDRRREGADYQRVERWDFSALLAAVPLPAIIAETVMEPNK